MYGIHNPVPQIQTVFRALVSMPVVLPQLGVKINEVKHGTELPYKLLTRQIHLLPERTIYELQNR